jgi:carboxylesterase
MRRPIVMVMVEDGGMTTAPTSPALVPGTEPFSADGGRTGVLLSHGFTGSPASMTPWGRRLAASGHTVRVPRLPGHGTTWQDMNTTRWQDWYGEVDTALTELRSRCDHVVVAGLSMGGCLALRLAEQRPTDVDAVVLVNPAVSLDRFDLKLVPLLQWLVPSMPGIGNDIKKPGQDEIGYDRTPLKALASQLQMWRATRADLAEITQPLLVFRSTEDHVLDATSVDAIRAGVSSTVSELVELTDSYHVATIDNDDQLIFERTAAFIDEHVGTP